MPASVHTHKLPPRPLRTGVRLALGLALAVLLCSRPANANAAPLDIVLPGTSSFDGWSGLNNFNYSGYGGFPGSSAWPGPIVSNEPGSADAQLSRVSGGADGGGPFLASESIYFGSFQQVPNRLGGTLRVSDATPLTGVKTIAFQIQIGEAVGYDFVSPSGTPALTVNGSPAPSALVRTALLNRYQSGIFTSPETGLDEPVYVNTWGYQWNVGSLGTITSFQIDFSGVTHSQVYALRLDQSDVAVTRDVFLPQFQLAGVGIPSFDGTDTTVTQSFLATPNASVMVEYRDSLSAGPWTSSGPHDTGATGSFSIVISRPGNHTDSWSKQMFYRAAYDQL